MSDKPITQKIKDRLADYTAMLRDIDNQIERLDRMAMTMTAPPGPDMTGMPRGSGTPTDRTGMMVARKLELEEQIKESIAEERRENAAIERMIRKLDHPDERAVIRLRYFDRAGWDEIAGALFGDRQDYLDKEETYQKRTFRLHGRALLTLAKVAEDMDTPTQEGAAQATTAAPRGVNESKADKMRVNGIERDNAPMLSCIMSKDRRTPEQRWGSIRRATVRQPKNDHSNTAVERTSSRRLFMPQARGLLHKKAPPRKVVLLCYSGLRQVLHRLQPYLSSRAVISSSGKSTLRVLLPSRRTTVENAAPFGYKMQLSVSGSKYCSSSNFLPR